MDKQKLKRVKNTLTATEKLAIVQKVKEGTSKASLARLYNVSKSSVGRFVDQENTIREEASNNPDTKNRFQDKIDNFIISWIKLLRGRNLPVSGPMICSKAREINDRHNIKAHFVVS